MQEATKDMGIDDKSSHPELCSDVADGVTRNIVCLFREPDAGNPPVRFDEREQETEPSQTGLRWRGESHVKNPPGDYSHCACSRLYSSSRRRGRKSGSMSRDIEAAMERRRSAKSSHWHL